MILDAEWWRRVRVIFERAQFVQRCRLRMVYQTLGITVRLLQRIAADADFAAHIDVGGCAWLAYHVPVFAAHIVRCLDYTWLGQFTRLDLLRALWVGLG